MAKKGIALLTTLGVLYEQMLRKGIFALVRLKKENGQTKFEFHADWDDEKYADVLTRARQIKKDKQSKKGEDQ